MLLKSISYVEFEGQEQEWVLEELPLGQRNLLVGKNATGKTRCLNIIGNLAKQICGEAPRKLLNGKQTLKFVDGSEEKEYQLHVEAQKVVHEVYSVNGVELLKRGAEGEGTIRAEKVNNGMMIEFQAPQDELAAFVRRDTKQHSYLEPLHRWATNVRHYLFGTQLGKDHFAAVVKRGGPPPPEGKDADQIVSLFLRAKRDFPGSFEEGVIRDMGRVDYPIESIGVKSPVSIKIDSNIPAEFVALYVKERDLRTVTDQVSMSQGMFRVLAILILTNYMECTQRPGCLLIDDIGEGLDFDRSCMLIDLLRERAERTDIQLIVSTNDRFIMNSVPLEEWAVLRRTGSHVQVKNHENAKRHFDLFKKMGLNNFDFFRYNFLDEDPDAVLEEVGADRVD